MNSIFTRRHCREFVSIYLSQSSLNLLECQWLLFLGAPGFSGAPRLCNVLVLFLDSEVARNKKWTYKDHSREVDPTPVKLCLELLCGISRVKGVCNEIPNLMINERIRHFSQTLKLWSYEHYEVLTFTRLCTIESIYKELKCHQNWAHRLPPSLLLINRSIRSHRSYLPPFECLRMQQHTSLQTLNMSQPNEYEIQAPFTLSLYLSGSFSNNAAASPLSGSVGLGYNSSWGRKDSKILTKSEYQWIPLWMRKYTYQTLGSMFDW